MAHASHSAAATLRMLSPRRPGCRPPPPERSVLHRSFPAGIRHGRKLSKIIWSAKRAARCRSLALRTTQVSTGRHKTCRAKPGRQRRQIVEHISDELRARRQGRQQRTHAPAQPRRHLIPIGMRPVFGRNNAAWQAEGPFAAALGAAADRTTSARPAPDIRPARWRRASGSRSSPSKRLFSSGKIGTRPPTRSQNSPSVIMRSALPRNVTRAKLGGGQLIEPCLRLR